MLSEFSGSPPLSESPSPQIVQLGWSLPLVLDTDAKRALETLSGVDDGFGNLTLEDSLLRRMAHLELAARDRRGSDNFEVGERNEVPDFQQIGRASWRERVEISLSC